MLSSSRVYIFKVEYQNSNWLSFKQANQLAGLIAMMLSTGIKDFTFKNLQFINVYSSNTHGIGEYGVQIHINKFTYYKQKILSKERIAELRNKIRIQLKKILQLKFQDVLIVNDEYDMKPTSGLFGG
jgi:hypothetical protein